MASLFVKNVNFKLLNKRNLVKDKKQREIHIFKNCKEVEKLKVKNTLLKIQTFNKQKSLNRISIKKYKMKIKHLLKLSKNNFLLKSS
jgi:hypothetical protein